MIRDTEKYARTCDACQRIDKGGEVKKAPLKLVRIISEVFSRINCHIVGPVPESEKGNKYILTAICIAFIYPEAIPLPDTKSVTVTDGLILIFSRLGYPKTIQCDLDTCFTSALKTSFFGRFGVKVIHSSVHRPQSNPIER